MNRDDEFEVHLFEYQFQRSTWLIEVKAKDAREARQRLAACAIASNYLGVSKAVFPAVPGAGLLVRALTWLRNR